MAVDPTGEGLKRFLAEDPGGPVVMLNLLRFREGGQKSYARYSKTVGELILGRYDSEVLYYGKGSTALVAEDGQAWDAVLLVRYPSREVFARMVADPDFQAVAHFRSEALSEAVLQATVPLG
ncbi:DUF1330 domain-containing protein [Actinomadura sediminis]|uniref:DUF1330 domain-containing protein n=1 Tax=Actinomadura sediminis TaxID=1038904 RepID=A0ABW3EHJ4_9ACTN